MEFPVKTTTSKSELQNMFVLHCFFQMLIGKYADIIKRWLKVFPRKQMHFVSLSELSKNTMKVMNGVYTFLSLGRYFTPGLYLVYKVLSLDIYSPCKVLCH